MINKRSVWFLTLFSLILVLSVYYITIPTEMMFNNGTYKEPNSSVSESTILTALRVEADLNMEEMMNDLRFVLTSVTSTLAEKSEAYDRLKQLNITRGEEEKLENLIKSEYTLDSFVKIDGDQIRVVVKSEQHNTDLASKIMKSVQNCYEDYRYVTVKFQ